MSTLRKFKKVVVAAGLLLTTTAWLASAVLMAPTALAYSDGTLLKDASSTNIYVVNNGMKVWVRSADVFNGCGYNWSKIKTVSSLSLTPTADLIKRADSSSPDVYRLEKNFRRKLASIEIFQSYSLDWNKVATVCSNILDSYSQAAIMQPVGSTNIYRVSSGSIRFYYPTMGDFTKDGMSVNDIITVNWLELNSYHNGGERVMTNDNYLIALGSPIAGETWTRGVEEEAIIELNTGFKTNVSLWLWNDDTNEKTTLGQYDLQPVLVQRLTLSVPTTLPIGDHYQLYVSINKVEGPFDINGIISDESGYIKIVASAGTMPQIFSLFPDGGDRGTTITTTISGVNLENDNSACGISPVSDRDLELLSCGFNATGVVATFRINATAEIGPKSIYITTPNGTGRGDFIIN